MIKEKNVLITGGAGFIGTHIAASLIEHNKVTVMDIDLNNALPYSPLAHDERVRKVEGDVRDWETVKREASQSQIILHFASILGVQEVIARARDTMDTILLGTRNVLEAARRIPDLERLVYISTSEVYGNALDAEEGTPASVGTDNDARLCYASAKLMGEHLMWAYHRDFQLPVVTVRPFNIYGPLRRTSHAVGIFIVKALRGQDIVLHGDGSQVRSWCYIDDFRDGMLSCIKKKTAIGHDFNLGNPVTAATIYDLAERIVRLTGSHSAITTTAYTYRDIGVRAPSSSKSRELLNYYPKHDMDAGLLPTIEWYRGHLDLFQHWV